MTTAMPRRPDAVLIDVYETMLSLEGLRPRFEAVGRPPHELELFFARVLRDGFAQTAAGQAAPFADIAAAVLHTLSGQTLDDGAVSHVISGFQQLTAHPDVEPALRALAEANVPAYAFTHGSAEIVATALDGAGLRGYLQEVFSSAEIQSFKGSPGVYHWACERVGTAPDRTALVAVHSWDTHGAGRAGLLTGYVTRFEGKRPEVFDAPTVTAGSLDEAVRALLALG